MKTVRCILLISIGACLLAQSVMANDSCMYLPKKSPAVRNKTYPFSTVAKVKLVSFNYHANNYPVKGDSVITDSLVEQKALNKAELNALTDILYNNFNKGKAKGTVPQLCFYPHNAILFLDKADRAYEYAIICFHCNNYQLSSDSVSMGDYCEGKMEKLRLFFAKAGIKMGTEITSSEAETREEIHAPNP